MERRGLALASLLVCAALVAAPAAPARERAPAVAKVVECGPTTADDGDGREGAFQARMRRVRGTRVMQVRFYLLERRGDGRFERVAAPGLGVWHSSRADVRRFVYTQRVSGLRDGASYRAVVHHRWIGADGERLRFARRRSDVCAAEGALPNLTISRISRQGGRYAVTVRNLGSASAQRVAVTLAVDELPLPVAVLPALAAGERRVVRFEGPPCDSGLSAIVDPGDEVRETSEADNARVLRCRR